MVVGRPSQVTTQPTAAHPHLDPLLQLLHDLSLDERDEGLAVKAHKDGLKEGKPVGEGLLLLVLKLGVPLSLDLEGQELLLGRGKV